MELVAADNGGHPPWEHARREGWEGVIAKRRGSPYEHRRSKLWLKMKVEASQELVVGGFTDPQGARVGLGALLVGYYEGRDFVFAGKLGTGFNTAMLRELRERLDRLEIPASPFTRGTGFPAAAYSLGPSRNRGAGGIHRVDRARQTAAPAAPRPARRQGGEGRHAGAAMITNPGKVLFPDAGITKGDLASYYEDVAAVMLPHLRGRPVTMERYPAGIGAQGFWQKDVSRGFPAWLTRVNVRKKGGGTVHYPIATDRRALQWMSNQNTITHHVWTSRTPRLDYPDICVFDLDPSDRRWGRRCARRRWHCATC